MSTFSDELNSLIASYGEMLGNLSEEDFAQGDPGKWSRREELGHLVDSAMTNLRRFVVSQYEDQPKITYDQNFWVQVSGYRSSDKRDLIALWILLNRQIASVLSNTPAENMNRICDTGKGTAELHSIQFLAEDYVRHAKHHLHHILDLEAVHY